jgi:hypothetical protein
VGRIGGTAEEQADMSEASEYHAAMGEFAGHMLCTAVAAHFMHWSTTSFAAHKALGEYYEAMPGLVDDVVEEYQGCYGLIGKFAVRMDSPRGKVQEALVAYFEDQKAYVEKARKKLPERSELQNDIDAIATLIDSTIYKLRFLS